MQLRAIDPTSADAIPAFGNPSQATARGGGSLLSCRSGCGACCTVPSISSPIPGMPNGKPAGVRCAQLTDDARCSIWGSPDRPLVCAHLMPTPNMCGLSAEEATAYFRELDRLTAPRLLTG